MVKLPMLNLSIATVAAHKKQKYKKQSLMHR